MPHGASGAVQRGFHRAQTAAFDFCDFFKLALIKISIKKYLPLQIRQGSCTLQNCIDPLFVLNLLDGRARLAIWNIKTRILIGTIRWQLGFLAATTHPMTVYGMIDRHGMNPSGQLRFLNVPSVQTLVEFERDLLCCLLRIFRVLYDPAGCRVHGLPIAVIKLRKGSIIAPENTLDQPLVC